MRFTSTLAIATGIIVAVVAVGLLLVTTATDGSKEAEVGAALLTGAVVGTTIVFLERSIDRAAAANESLAGVVAVAPSDGGTAADKADVEADVDPETGRVREHDAMEFVPESFEIEWAGWQRDGSRIDASQARLRVMRASDHSYFQFFTAVAPGPAIRTHLGMANVGVWQFRRAFARSAAEQIRVAIQSRKAPLPDPTTAIEVFPDVGRAVQHAGSEPDNEPEIGEVIETLTVALPRSDDQTV